MRAPSRFVVIAIGPIGVAGLARPPVGRILLVSRAVVAVMLAGGR
jgi:hypothetical protein